MTSFIVIMTSEFFLCIMGLATEDTLLSSVWPEVTAFFYIVRYTHCVHSIVYRAEEYIMLHNGFQSYFTPTA